MYIGCFDKIIHTPALRTGEDVIQALKGLEGNISQNQFGNIYFIIHSYNLQHMVKTSLNKVFKIESWSYQ